MTALALRVLGALLRRLPLGAARSVGAFLGLAWFHLVPIRRATSIRQIRAALGLGTADARRVARETYRNLGRSAAEFLRVDDAAATVRVSGWDRYLAARARGRGVVVVTGHFGNWDLLACAAALRGEPVHVVTKDLKDSGVNALWMEARRRAGVRLHAAAGSMPALVAALRAGEVVALVIDQDAPFGVALPFFGKDANTSLAPAVLARRTGAPILPVFLARDPDGAGHEMQIGEEIPPDDVSRSVLMRCNAALESAIRARPDHWLWLHRRWRSAEG